MERKVKPKIGVFSGTFDPVHEGHLSFCLEAIRQCGLDKVVIIPERSPRSKPGASDVTKRLSALEHAISLLPVKPGVITAALLSSDKATVRETMPELRQLCGNSDITLLIGSDVAANLAHWDNLGKVLDDVHFAIGLRGDTKAANIRDEMESIKRQYGKDVHYTIVQSPYAHLSSSAIRAKSNFSSRQPL